jgi:hypothetical protein
VKVTTTCRACACGDHGHLTDFRPRGLVGFAVNAEDERPDNPELLQALLDRANRARRGAVVQYIYGAFRAFCTVQFQYSYTLIILLYQQ